MSIIIKNAEQIEGIRKSSKLAGETLVYIEEFVKEGVNTEYLDALINKFIEDHGAVFSHHELQWLSKVMLYITQ